MSTSTDDLAHGFPPLIRVYKDGRVERLKGTEIAPPSTNPKTGVQSKDIIGVGTTKRNWRRVGGEGWWRSWRLKGKATAFHMFKPTCDNAGAMLTRVVAFINEDMTH
ncbi:hypothetical protein Acr_06g0015480 [Actinidia rufa]|uniref:Uncharacterized protein n=1 Tax=Actinidia rufa TaxID=165716 RepID=A0A7J0ET98_9ERIC|nr:hypothetical protein Acr_06g0015480 [Actinidia rufa]